MAGTITPATLAALSSFLADAPEEITLDAVKASPELARLVILSDQISALVGRRTLEWLKTSGTGCEPLKAEKLELCPMMGSNTPNACPICGTPRGKGCGYGR